MAAEAGCAGRHRCGGAGAGRGPDGPLGTGSAGLPRGVPRQALLGAVTVRGWFERFEGEGAVGPDGKVAGQLVMDAASLNTKNKQRDRHLRSADFFDAADHPQVVVTVSRAELTHGGQLAAEGELEAAGVREPLSFTGEVVDASADAVTVQAEVTVDRSRFGMTWSPLRMTSMQAPGSVAARFTRASAGSPPAAGPA